MTSRMFHLGTLLSITTGILLPGDPKHRHPIYCVYDILDFMEGHDHWTHELPSASRRMEPVLLEQHPWLAEIALDDPTRASIKGRWKEWLDEQVVQYGEWHEVQDVPTIRTKSPIETLQEMTDKPIIAVVREPDAQPEPSGD